MGNFFRNDFSAVFPHNGYVNGNICDNRGNYASVPPKRCEGRKRDTGRIPVVCLFF